MLYVAASHGEAAHGCTPGADALMAGLVQVYGFSPAKGCYNDRSVRGSVAPSVHRDGRAIDPAVDAWAPGRGEWTPPAMSWNTVRGSDPVLLARMQRAIGVLTAHYEQLGVQLIIHATKIWTCERMWWRDYAGTAGPHWDHAHIEVHPSKAHDLTLAQVLAVLAPRPLSPNPLEDDDMLPTLYSHDGDDRILKEGADAPHLLDGNTTLDHLRSRGCPEVAVPALDEWNRKLGQAGLAPFQPSS